MAIKGFPTTTVELSMEQAFSGNRNPPADSHALLSVLTPDSVGPLALSCLLAAQGPNSEVRRQGAHAVDQFQGLVSSFDPATAEGIFLGRLERVAYAAAATMIEADQDARNSIEQAQLDYETALLGSSVKSQVYFGVVKWLVRVLLLMGVSFFIAKMGIDWAVIEMNDSQRSRSYWLPYALMFAVPIFIGVGQSLWRVYTTTNLVYQRDVRILEARKRRRAKQQAAIRYAKEQARLAWDDFVEPGTPLPQAHPTLDLLHVLYMEELRTRVTPPLSVLLVNALRRKWRHLVIKRKQKKRDHQNQATGEDQ
jgi:hypothetical protein